MPTEHTIAAQELNSYNVAQLQYALYVCLPHHHTPPLTLHTTSDSKDPAVFLLSPASSPHVIPIEPDLDYDSRRMSSSATSTADTDSSGLSRPEKRSLTPADSPQPKKSRNEWDDGDKPLLDDDPAAKVQLPSIFTTFEDSYRANGDARRASLPPLHSESRVRHHAPYPPTGLRQAYSPSNQPSSLSSYTFPPPNDPEVSSDTKSSSRPRVSTDFIFGNGSAGSFESPYGLSNGTTPSSAFGSPSSTDYQRSAGLSPYPDGESWSTSASGIVRPSSTPGQLSSPAVKYEDQQRHASFSAPMPQAQ
ncbi:hypothetical protein H0H87_009684, partial [Tephrocybe sp. NHM501043]